MYAGRVVEQGPADQVFTDPLHPYAARPVGVVPADRRPGGPVRAGGPAGRPARPAPSCRPAVPFHPALPAGRSTPCTTWPSPPSRPAAPTGPPPASGWGAHDGVIAEHHRAQPRGARPGTCEFAGRGGAGRAAPSTGSTCACAAGEIVALVGESGSGKTTLARALHRPRAAEPRRGASSTGAAGLRSARGAARRSAAGSRWSSRTPPGALNPRHTVYESVAEGLRLHRLAADRPRAAAPRSSWSPTRCPSAGLRPPERLFLRYPHELSGGQRQRVLIAGALALATRAADRRRAGLQPGRLDPRRDPGAAAQAASRARPRACSWSPTTSGWPGTSPTGSR